MPTGNAGVGVAAGLFGPPALPAQREELARRPARSIFDSDAGRRWRGGAGQVCRWFADRSDLILLLFDAHKLDISDEFKTVRGTLSLKYTHTHSLFDAHKLDISDEFKTVRASPSLSHKHTLPPTLPPSLPPSHPPYVPPSLCPSLPTPPLPPPPL